MNDLVRSYQKEIIFLRERLKNADEALIDAHKEIGRNRFQLRQADEILLDVHAQITTFSKYTASRVYEWKDIRGKDGSEDLKEFDDNGRDE